MYHEAVKGFIRKLPKLSALEILDWNPSSALTPALPPNLRKLFLRYPVGLELWGCRSFNAQDIAELANRCPKIQDLLIWIRRSRGDANEVAVYKALGRFRNLRHVNLTLDASPPPRTFIRYVVVDEDSLSDDEEADDEFDYDSYAERQQEYDTKVESHFDDFDAEYIRSDLFPNRTSFPYRNGHIRDVFINSALDHELARAIFFTILSAQASSSDVDDTYNRKPQMETLAVRVHGGGRFSRGFNPVIGFLPYLENELIVERSPRDGSPDVLAISPLDYTKKHYRGNSILHDDRIRREGLNQDNPLCIEIWRRLWPEKPGGSDWWTDWHSLPLQTEVPE